MRVVFSLFLILSTSWASWVFVNDDGTFSPYNEEEAYVIPKGKAEDFSSKTIKIREKSKPVVAKEKPAYQEVLDEEEPKIMYLTFDDGPLPGSANVISVLQEESVPATMFMVGEHINKSPSHKRVYQHAINAPFILVANHTYCHANGQYRHFYNSKKRVLDDVNHMDALLAKDDLMHDRCYMRLAGRNVFRLPDMSRDDLAIPERYGEKSSYDALYEAGFFIYGWDLQWEYDGKSGLVRQSPKNLVKKIEKIYKKKKTIRANKFILLMHDFSFKTKLDGKKTLSKLIQILRQKGWRFETLETYL